MSVTLKKIVPALFVCSTMLVANFNLVTPLVSASTKEYSCAFVPINTPIRTNWEKSCSVPKFNTALGNLTKVTLILKGQIAATMNVKNGDPAPRSGTTTTTGNITVKAPNSDNITASPSISYTDTLTACEQNCGDTVKAIAPTLDTTPTGAQKNYPLSYGFKDASGVISKNFDSYIGTGNVDFVANASAASSTTFGGNYSLNGLANAAAELSVVYEYSSRPIAENGTFGNTIVNGNVDLSKSLIGKPEVGNINYYIINTLPDSNICDLYLGNNLVKVKQIIEPGQVKDLVCKPKPGSEGKSTSFIYTAVDSQGVESNPATVNINLMKAEPVIEAPKVEATLAGPTITTKDCSILGKQGETTTITGCLKTINGTAQYYKIYDIKTGKSKNGESCGNFTLNGVIITENQKISEEDKDKIQFVSTSSECMDCNVGFSFVAVDSLENKSNPSRVNVNLDCVTVEPTLARTGGEQGNIKEVIVLFSVLIGSMVFFVSSLSTDTIKKVFSRK
jgi:hypothetical protein